MIITVPLQLSGARRTCSLFVDAVTRQMHGEWMCLLNEISQFNSVKHTVQLQVGVEARLSWKMIQGYDGTVETELEGESPALQLTEGDEVKIVCVATEGFPLMQFQWEHQGVSPPSQPSLANSTKQRTGREYKVRVSLLSIIIIIFIIIMWSVTLSSQL